MFENLSNIYESDGGIKLNDNTTETMVKKADVAPVEDGFLQIDGRINHINSRFDQKRLDKSFGNVFTRKHLLNSRKKPIKHL